MFISFPTYILAREIMNVWTSAYFQYFENLRKMNEYFINSQTKDK
jgi:hypothetical protein